MTRDDLHAMLTRAKAAYQPVDTAADSGTDDVVTVTRATEDHFAVWRLEGEAWVRCGTITIKDDARAWNAGQMERFWSGRSGSTLQLGCLEPEPPPPAGALVTKSDPAGPIESIMRVVHLVWTEVYGDDVGYRPLWCDDVALGTSQVTRVPRGTARGGGAKRGRGRKPTCTVVEVQGSGRALRWA